MITKQVEELKMELVKQYDIELFTVLFGVINIINVKKICVSLFFPLRSDTNFKKKMCKIFHEQIRCLETQNTVSENVSCILGFMTEFDFFVKLKMFLR